MSKDEDKDDIDELNALFNKPDESGRVEAMKQLFDTSNGSIKMKSEVDKNLSESHYFAGLYTLNYALGNNLLAFYSNNNLKLRVSNNRKGRQECVDMNRQVTGEEKKRGFLSRMFNSGV